MTLAEKDTKDTTNHKGQRLEKILRVLVFRCVLCVLSLNTKLQRFTEPQIGNYGSTNTFL